MERLTKLSVQIGAKVYETDGLRVYESTVMTSYVHEGRDIWETDTGVVFDARAIGSSIFLTRENAEEIIRR